MCDMLAASDNGRVVASATNVSLEFLAELLVYCEFRQLDFVANLPMQANVVQKREDVSSQFKNSGSGFNKDGRFRGTRGYF